MSCTTLLVGKNASYNGSTMIARNDDSGSGKFTSKKWVVVKPEDQPRQYESVLSHVKINLPDNPMRYTAMPNAEKGEGVWAAAGVNEKNVGMTATETITTNERVLGADPLVEYVKAEDSSDGQEHIGGIGEEDLVLITLPYISSAREGLKRLGSLIEQYGTYEMNGIGFSDADEIWWLETIGGHHWIAKRVPDDSYVVMPNQLGIDEFDLSDALGEKKNHMCSADLKEFIRDNHLDLDQVVRTDDIPGINQKIKEKIFNDSYNEVIDARAAFGSHDDSDHCYNTPRAWYMLKTLNPHGSFNGPHAKYRPESDDLPWSMVPEKKITSEEVKYVLSSHYQGTPFDPYEKPHDGGAGDMRGKYRSIGINRNDFIAILEIRSDVPEDIAAIEWIAYASNAFNTMVPYFANVTATPEYMNSTTGDVSTDSFYWTSRLIAALTDHSYATSLFEIERYTQSVVSKGRHIINEKEKAFIKSRPADVHAFLEDANNEIAAMLKTEAERTLKAVLNNASNNMKNCYSRSDA